MADESKGARICRAYDQGKQLRQNHDSRVDLLAPFIDPTRYGVQPRVQPIEGASLMANVYDSSGIFAADLATNYIMTHIANPSSKWMGLRERRSELNDLDEVREWLEELRDRMLRDRATNNFYPESHQMVKDWLGFGGGNMIVEEGPMLPYRRQFGYQGTRWTTNKVGRFVIFENGWHMVDQTYVDFYLTAQMAVERFGQEKVSEKIRNCYNKNDYQSKFLFIHAVYPRKEQEKERTYGNRAMPFASCYVEYDSKQVVKESGYGENPYVNPRYMKVPGEVYGRGRGELALNDLLTLNTAKRLELEALALAIRFPYWVANDSVFGTIDLQPGQMNTIKVPHGSSIRDVLMMHTNSGNFEVTQIKEDELRKSIMETFYVQQIREIMMLENRPGEMTLGEYARRLNLLHKIAGAVYPTLENEGLKPDVERQFSLMYDAGEFSNPPDVLLEQGGSIDVIFDNPLARAQRLEEVEAMDRMLARIGPIADMQVKYGGRQYAEILDNFPFDKWVQKIAEIEGVPATLVNSERQVMVLRGSRAEAEQAQQAGQGALMATEGARNIAPLVKALQERRAA